MAESFETYRPYLFSIAYRMLSSAMDAEDVVQETYLRYQDRVAQPEGIISLKAFLTTILTRLCMDQLHLARRQRETYLGPWLPEPIGDSSALEVVDPEERVDREESVSLAFLVLLEELQPVERAVFLLREVFEYEYAEIASFLGRSEIACRQAFSRAKKHLAERRPRFQASPETHRQLLTGFLQAVQVGDMDTLMSLLSDDVTLYADGGGKVKGAATRPISGSSAVARFAIGTRQRFLPERYRIELASVNRQPAIVIRGDERAYLVLTIEVEADRIRTVRIVANPEKLARV
ncbi:MAG TPA: RNA polymerase sigma-70 factor [Ktedonobacterales bacterium]|nr:RNA polymerase sigma-70 factor [Ktedonobacterales bacterium]